MTFTDTQVHQLKAKLEPKHVRTREANGASLHYVEGWHVIAEANRIFGYDAWDRRTISTACVWSGSSGSYHAAAYTARVRVSVRAGDTTIVREGSGSSESRAPTPGQAHELALKGAETDATKRALATFGNPFGLALYDRDQSGVRKLRGAPATGSGPWVLCSASGSPIGSHENADKFIQTLRRVMSESRDIELLYDVWEQNLETLRVLHKDRKGQSLIPKLVNHLRACAVALVKSANVASNQPASPLTDDERERRGTSYKIDKCVLTLSEPKRLRSKEHLRFVATQPCLICGRRPSHAHHLRHAQPRGLSLKVSDEFTVPLCAIHHNQIHTTAKEKEWWQERNIDPLKVAGELWRQSREPLPAGNASSERPEPPSTQN